MDHLYIAQKGFVYSKNRKQILVIRYSDAKYTSDKVKGKLGLPGGKMAFGENPNSSFIREVEEETGITIKAGGPFHIYTWTYPREMDFVQIVAVARVGYFLKGNIHKISVEEKESKISEVKWINIKEIQIKDFISDEQPVIKKFLEYSKINSFT